MPILGAILVLILAACVFMLKAVYFAFILIVILSIVGFSLLWEWYNGEPYNEFLLGIGWVMVVFWLYVFVRFCYHNIKERMMIQPREIKYVCKQCGYSKVYQPKSDCLSGGDLIAGICPKCKKAMESCEPSVLDIALAPLSNILKDRLCF